MPLPHVWRQRARRVTTLEELHLDQGHPIVRLVAEIEVFVVPSHPTVPTLIPLLDIDDDPVVVFDFGVVLVGTKLDMNGGDVEDLRGELRGVEVLHDGPGHELVVVAAIDEVTNALRLTSERVQRVVVDAGVNHDLDAVTRAEVPNLN